MGSWMRCICGGLIHLNMFAGTHIYQLVEDSEYDAVEDPVDREKLEELFFRRGITVYRCLACGRLVVDWSSDGSVTFYLPESTRSEPVLAPGSGQEMRREEAGQERTAPVDERLRELEALAEGEYDRMYDSRDPTGCYSRAKEAFYGAIRRAAQLGLEEDVKRLEKRLRHVKDVFRHQFT